MAFWARVLDGVVQEPARELPELDLPSQYFPDTLPGTWLLALDGSPQSGWTYADGVYSPPVPPAPTLAQQAAAALAAGLTIESTGRPEVNGTYSASPTAQQQIQAQIVSILLDNIFTNGQATTDWPDLQGASHNFDIATFKGFARAMALFVDSCQRCETGLATALPAASATIA